MDLHEHLSSDLKGDMYGYLRFEIRTMNMFFARKYDNAEAKNTIIIIFACGLDYFASALAYFLAKTCASYIYRYVDIQGYLF